MLDYRYLCIGALTGILFQDLRLKAPAAGLLPEADG